MKPFVFHIWNLIYQLLIFNAQAAFWMVAHVNLMIA